jgi:hypothetical protein
MKNPIDVLRFKEQELIRVKREIEALRVALPLLGDDGDSVRPTSMFGSAQAAQKAVPLP